MSKIEILSQLIEKYRAISASSITPHDYASLRDSILLLELKEELSILEGMLASPESFDGALRQRIKERQNDPTQSIPAGLMSQSIANQLYWELAAVTFQPKTLIEALTLFYPVTCFVYPVIDETEQFPVEVKSTEAQKGYMRQRLEEYAPIRVLSAIINPAETLQEEPTLVRFSQIIFAEGLLFDMASIQGFPLGSLAHLLSMLKKDYPALHERFVDYNEATQALVIDVDRYQGNRGTPRAAFEALIKGLKLGGQRMTGQGYASASAQAAIKQFFTYFLGLPEETQGAIRALSVGGLKFGDILEKEIEKGECVETTAGELERILKANQSNGVLDSHPALSQRAFNALVRKYHSKEMNWQQMGPAHHLVQLTALPSRWVRDAIAKIELSNGEDLVVLLLNFPPNFYEPLWAALMLSNPKKTMEALALAIASRFFNPEQRKALAAAIARHYGRLQIEELSSLVWARYCDDPQFIAAVLELYPEEERLAALKVADYEGYTILHLAANDPESLKVVLALLPEGERLAAVKVVNKHGDTVLHVAADNPESLKAVLALYPKGERLAAVKVANIVGNTVLHVAADNPESLKAVLALYPEGERLAAVKVANKHGYTVLDFAFNNPESLKEVLALYPEGERLSAVKVVDKQGRTALHNVARNPESLKEVLALYPEGERLAAVKVADNVGDTVLHGAVDNPESLKAVLALYPEGERLAAVKVANIHAQTLLHLAARNPESLKAVLALYPEGERLAAVKVADNYGETVLHRAADNPESVKAVLALLPERERLAVLRLNIKSKPVMDRIGADIVIEGSFIHEYLIIERHMRADAERRRGGLFSPQPCPLWKRIESACDFDEVKTVVLDFISQEENQRLAEVQSLLNELAKGQENPHQFLSEAWGMSKIQAVCGN